MVRVATGLNRLSVGSMLSLCRMMVIVLLMLARLSIGGPLSDADCAVAVMMALLGALLGVVLGLGVGGLFGMHVLGVLMIRLIRVSMLLFRVD